MENNPKYIFVDEVSEISENSLNDLLTDESNKKQIGIILIGIGISSGHMILSCASAIDIYKSCLKECVEKELIDLGKTILSFNCIEESQKHFDVNIIKETLNPYYHFFYVERYFPDLPVNIKILKGYRAKVPSEILPRSDQT